MIMGDFNAPNYVNHFQSVNSSDTISLITSNFLSLCNLSQHNSVLNNKANYLNLYSEIQNIDWSNLFSINIPDDACSFLYELIYKTFDNNVPTFKSYKFSKVRTFPAWINYDLQQLIRNKDKLRGKYICSNSNIDKAKFVESRLKVKRLIKEARSNYIRQSEDSVKTDPSKLWSYLNTIKGSTRLPGIMPLDEQVLSDPVQIVCGFAKYFCSVYSESNCDEQVVLANPALLGNYSLDEHTVLKHLRKLKGKFTSGFDYVPSFLLKDCAMVLARPLTYIFNTILSNGLFPTCWKKVRL